MMASPMGGPGGMGGHPPNMGGVGPPMGGPGSGPGGPNPGMGPMGGPGSMGGMGGPGPIGGPMGGPPGPMGGPGERIDQHPGGPPFFNRRHPGPYFNQPDYRIYELNKRLQQRTEVVAMVIFSSYCPNIFEYFSSSSFSCSTLFVCVCYRKVITFGGMPLPPNSSKTTLRLR